MTRKQAAMIVGLNALISLLISVAVVLTASFLQGVKPAAEPTRSAELTTTLSVAQALPSATPVLHTVQSGDTLSGLALQYDVPAEDIVAANNIQNPNFLQVGMQLLIPVGGVPPVTATFTPAPTETEPPIPFQPPSADMTATAAALAGATATSLPTPMPTGGDLRVEITGVIKPGQPGEEAVVITNVGTSLADLLNWTLSDAGGNVYTFPRFRLWAQGSLTVFTRVGQDGDPVSSLYWGKLEPVWSPGETATLKDGAGQVVATYTVGR